MDSAKSLSSQQVIEMLMNAVEEHRAGADPNDDLKQAKKFAQASRRGWEWAASHPDETLDIVMKYVQENHIITNRTLQKLMLEEILRLQVDRDSGKREFRLRPDMVKKLSQLLMECRMLKHEVTYEQLIAK